MEISLIEYLEMDRSICLPDEPVDGGCVWTTDGDGGVKKVWMNAWIFCKYFRKMDGHKSTQIERPLKNGRNEALSRPCSALKREHGIDAKRSQFS